MKCGCTVRMLPDSFGNPIEDRHPVIVFCSLHQTAELMRQELIDLRIGYSDIFTVGTLSIIDDILSLAEGRHE